MTGEPGGEGLIAILCAAQLADFNLELPVSSSGCDRTQDHRAVEDAVRRSTPMRFSTEGIEVSGVKGAIMSQKGEFFAVRITLGDWQMLKAC